VVVDPVGWGLGMSAYIHLNPVRVARLGLGKSDRQEAKAGAGALPEDLLLKQRIKSLRAYPWSSYRAYLGLAPRPEWLSCEEVLRLGGGSANDQKGRYREYVEDQVREGLQRKPWEELQDQTFLGGAQFIEKVRQAASKELVGAPRKPRWLRQSATLPKVIEAVEAVRGEKWKDFKERHGDNGRDLVLLLARRTTGLTIAELVKALDLAQTVNVSMAIKRYEVRTKRNAKENAFVREAAQMLNATL
jgi:hypothetical protein